MNKISLEKNELAIESSTAGNFWSSMIQRLWLLLTIDY